MSATHTFSILVVVTACGAGPGSPTAPAGADGAERGPSPAIAPVSVMLVDTDDEGGSEPLGGSSAQERDGEQSSAEASAGPELDTGASGLPSDSTVDDGFTLDPPLPDGTGSTADPPGGETGDPPDGQTGDPPGGDTGDPPGGDTGDPPPGDTGDPPPGDTGDPPSVCIPSSIDGVNVIVFEDAAPSGADTLGGMYVGGDASLDNYAMGSGLDKDCTRDDLVVGGVLSGTPVVHNGAVAYGELATNDGTFSCGAREDAPVDFVALRTEMLDYSRALTNLPSNGTTELAMSQLSLVGNDPTLNVFAVSAAQLEAAREFVLSVPDGSSVLVNVSGTAVSWTSCGFVLPDGNGSCISGSTSWCHRILYNFYEAQTLHFDGIGVQGSVLAPYAALNDPTGAGAGGGNVDGQVIVESLYGNTEYHDFFFTGCLMWPSGS